MLEGCLKLNEVFVEGSRLQGEEVFYVVPKVVTKRFCEGENISGLYSGMWRVGEKDCKDLYIDGSVCSPLICQCIGSTCPLQSREGADLAQCG